MYLGRVSGGGFWLAPGRMIGKRAKIQVLPGQPKVNSNEVEDSTRPGKTAEKKICCADWFQNSRQEEKSGVPARQWQREADPKLSIVIFPLHVFFYYYFCRRYGRLRIHMYSTHVFICVHVYSCWPWGFDCHCKNCITSMNCINCSINSIASKEGMTFKELKEKIWVLLWDVVPFKCSWCHIP